VKTTLGLAVLTSALLAPGFARAESPPHEKVGLFGGAGYLASPGLGGAAFMLGVRYLPIKYVAVAFDAGYGVIGHAPEVQDRWWLMPSVAVVLPLRRVSFDLGVGLGLGACSGYASWDAYVASPFGPAWALQLVPALRGHAAAIVRASKQVDVFVRFDVASVLGNSIGSRVDDPHPPTNAWRDDSWLDLMVGVHARVL
jgi:hypothetical protein